MDLFPSRTRFRNIFGQAGDQPNITRNIFPIGKIDTKATTRVNKGPLEEDDASKLLMDTYNEPSPAVSRLNQYVEEQPDREDYKPSKKRKVGAILAGLATGFVDPNAGAAVTRGVLDSPFEHAQGDWERRGVPIKNAAVAETQARTQKINSLKDYLAAKRADTLDRSLINDREHDNKLGDATLLETVANHQDTARRAEEAERNREADREADNKRLDAGAAETGRHNKRTEDIAAQNAASTAQRVSAYVAGQNSLSAYRDHLKTKIKPNDKSPAAQKTARDLAIVETVMKPGNSQKYGNYYDMDEKGKITIKPPSRGFFSSDQDFNNEMLDYSAFLKEIEGEGTKILGNTNTEKPKTTIPPKPKAVVVGRERG